MPVTQWNSVVLPAPFGPISARRSPGATLSETPSTARRPPNTLARLSTSTTAVMAARLPPVPAGAQARKEADDAVGAHSTVAMKTTPITAVCSSKKLLTQLRSPSKMPAPRNGPTIVPDPPTIAIRETSTEIWNEAATGLTKRL